MNCSVCGDKRAKKVFKCKKCKKKFCKTCGDKKEEICVICKK